MPEMKNSNVKWLGDIPSDWKVLRVKDGFTQKKLKAHQDDPVVLTLARSGVKIRDMSNAEGQFASSYYDYNPVTVDDMLINPMDLISGDNCSLSKVEGVISPAYVNLRHREGFYPAYYQYYFKYQYWCMAFFAHGKGVSFENRWTLNNETLMKFPLIIPPFEVQKSIANFLDQKCSEIDSLSADIQSQIDVLEEYKKSVIAEAVTKGLNPDVEMKDSGIEWIGEINKNWSIASVKYLYDIVLGKMVDSHQYPDDLMSNYLCAANIKWSGIDLSINKKMHFSESEKKQYLLKKNDVLIMEGGNSGTTCIYNEEFAPCYIQNSVLRCRPKDGVVAKMLYYWNYIVFHCGYIGATCNKATITHYTKEKVETTPIIHMPYSEQQLIVAYLDEKCTEIDAIINDKKAQLETLAEYKKSLIYEYVTGKKEVPENV